MTNPKASASRELTAAIVRELTEADGSARVTYRGLAAEPLSHLTLPAFGEADSQEALAEFKAAETVVIGAPMYNFTIPSQLKSWIDRLLVAGETFRYTATGAVVVRYDGALASAGGDRVATRRFEASVPADGTAASVGPALNAAANQVAAQVASWVGGS